MSCAKCTRWVQIGFFLLTSSFAGVANAAVLDSMAESQFAGETPELLIAPMESQQVSPVAEDAPVTGGGDIREESTFAPKPFQSEVKPEAVDDFAVTEVEATDGTRLTVEDKRLGSQAVGVESDNPELGALPTQNSSELSGADSSGDGPDSPEVTDALLSELEALSESSEVAGAVPQTRVLAPMASTPTIRVDSLW